MDVTALKGSSSKARPKEMLHRDYKNLDQDKLKPEFKSRIQNESIECYSYFEKVFVDILDEHALFKKEFLRANYVPYITKRLRKAIMKRSELKSKYLKIQTQESFQSYKKQ